MYYCESWKFQELKRKYKAPLEESFSIWNWNYFACEDSGLFGIELHLAGKQGRAGCPRPKQSAFSQHCLPGHFHSGPHVLPRTTDRVQTNLNTQGRYMTNGFVSGTISCSPTLSSIHFMENTCLGLVLVKLIHLAIFCYFTSQFILKYI